MLGYLAYTPPLAVFWLVLIIVNYAGIALGVALRRPLGLESGEPHPKALDVMEGVIVTLAA